MIPDSTTTHRPKGSMCMNCDSLHLDCSGLAFSEMKNISADDDGTVVVKCSRYKSAENDHKR